MTEAVAIANGGAGPESSDGRRDIERAVAELAERLPEPLVPLARLVFNYRWSWTAGGAELFQDIDVAAWHRCGCNPRYVIEATSPRRFQQLAQDPQYVARVAAVARQVDRDLAFVPHPVIPADRPVAYFCSEFAVHCSLPLYGGGLGVLAGDLLKAASDLAVPMVGIGLLYREGYFHQRLDPQGWQREHWISTDFGRVPAVQVTGSNGQPLIVEVTIRGRNVKVQVWRIDIGRVPLYLLDTDREDNHPIDRWITDRLYIGDRHTRLAQYAVLGIGGVRALDALGIRPWLIHLNEGHAALSAFERVRRLVEAGQPLEAAIANVQRETIFTTHTPVAAGNEGYSREELEPVLSDFIDQLGIGRDSFYRLGRVNPDNDHEPANITPLALRTSRNANAVSRRHGDVARRMWHPLWPYRAVQDVPIGHVTNGVHTMTWMAPAMQALLDRHLGAEWRTRTEDAALWDRIDQIPDEELWAVRGALRALLVDDIRQRSIFDRLARGEDPDYVESAARVFDPNVFTIGFARRVATYKRLYLLTLIPEWAWRVLSNPAMPIQVVVAGKAHPSDQEAKETLSRFYQLKRAPEAIGRVVFLEDYDLRIAPRIVAGVDLWLNLPRPPLEASGTSGMKVTLNGGVNFSVLDGWWEEAYDGQNGWAITTPPGDPHVQDQHDAEALLGTLEREIIPLFYDRASGGVPHGWLRRVKTAMRTLIPRFTASRMLQEYVDQLYTNPTVR